MPSLILFRQTGFPAIWIYTCSYMNASANATNKKHRHSYKHLQECISKCTKALTHTHSADLCTYKINLRNLNSYAITHNLFCGNEICRGKVRRKSCLNDVLLPQMSCSPCPFLIWLHQYGKETGDLLHRCRMIKELFSLVCDFHPQSRS